MTEDLILVRHVVVEGRVQGVGYREFTRRSALRLRVSGWVRNCRDGAVEARLRGAAADVEAMLAEMRRGPPGARVVGLRILESDEREFEETTFVVRATL